VEGPALISSKNRNLARRIRVLLGARGIKGPRSGEEEDARKGNIKRGESLKFEEEKGVKEVR